MQPDPLQQLRDVHLPADPSWWPPAIGWWVLLLALTGVVTWLIYKGISRWRRGAALRRVKVLQQENYTALANGDITDLEFADRTNELIKRLLVRAMHQRSLAPLAGDAWLQALDQLSGTEMFTRGPGNALGSLRFQLEPEFDSAGLNDATTKLFGSLNVNSQLEKTT